ncbi:granulocyte-macrophage colony-stimulating factor receptor subunit alpha-like [Scomber japonicus]|uniref:granulocyte-macrophage colony-stimulating factor receptor subunit alpha-like n=1 Tax=Scomber japonicus TaxID=13676 RepID=UPI0023061216|nr:granulocyte-macrophage colony-stimulating factor receptor subunit alpha-like [Scomber japonicus]
MKLLPTPLIFWSSILLLFCFTFSQCETEGSDPDFCQNPSGPIELHSSFPEDNDIDDIKDDQNFSCVHRPTNTLNCSWSFQALQEDTQLSVSLSICDDETEKSLRHLSDERVGSESMVLPDYKYLTVILIFNVSLNDMWKVYSYTYDSDTLEVLSPPPFISASINNGSLLVNWTEPLSQTNIYPHCFEYQLDIGDQEKHIHLPDTLSYTKLNADADPQFTYRVRIRARVKQKTCSGSSQWSDWSSTVKVGQPVAGYDFSILVVLSISLGIPMILLAVVLLVRYQRVTKVLFPPIPHPPSKYKNFLEKNDTFNFFYAAPSVKPEEEITEVVEAEQKPEKPV